MSGLFWNDYPYTDFHELNLSFIIKKVIELNETVKNFVSLNTVKYADPIQWNITTQYEKNTVVVEPNTGTAYISVAPVPTGVAITNTDYWTPIFTLNLQTANQNITLRDDGSNVLSTFASDVGDWLLWNGTLYKVSQTINVNEAYVVGYNIDRYTVEEFMKDYVQDIKTDIGDLDDLDTTDKTSLVNAINEINDISVDNKKNIDNMRIFNVLDYGAVGDGVTDDTTAIKNAILACKSNGGGIVYFPKTANEYIVSDTLSLDGNIFVKGDGLSIIRFNSSVLFMCSGIYGGIEDIHAISTNSGTFIHGDCSTATMYRWRFHHLIAENCAHTFNQTVVPLADYSGSYMFECKFDDILSFRCLDDIFITLRSRGFLQFNDINMDCTYSTVVFPHVGIKCYDFVGVHLTDCNLYGPTAQWVPTPSYTASQWAIMLNGGGTSATAFITRCMNDTTFGNGIYIGYCSYVHILGVKSFNTWGRGVLLDHVEHLDGVNFYLNGAKGLTDALADDNSGLVLANCNFVNIANVESYNFKGYGVSEYNCNNVHITNAQLYLIDTVAYRELDDNNSGMKSNILGDAAFHSNTTNIVQQSNNAVCYNYSLSGTMNARTQGAFSA